MDTQKWCKLVEYGFKFISRHIDDRGYNLLKGSNQVNEQQRGKSLGFR